MPSIEQVPLVTQKVKRLSTMRETWVRSLGREDALEKEMATHSSTLAWKIPWMGDPGRLQFMRLQRVRHDWATSLSLSLLFKSIFWSLFLGGSVVKNLPANVWDTGDVGLIPGSGRSLGEVNGNPLQYSCLENLMDRAWQATVSP